ncbi:predicted protein [Naegleria gruberi]|uniref:Predicted protein n=1 Tax=Naegleria gruberi TaxID=5762 RepID=D2VRG9_NAEGR|nr:uncharacterized protein NAEGRDRAFT_71582 [Naegleria gruberi]EFC40602.1 predicted protein [Naegleria gruberi]|eukprot:XP_002673346.1 predicted protein [Naegleria gruberi strain NEG-M]
MRKALIISLLIACLLSCVLLMSNNQVKAEENDDFWNAIPTTTVASNQLNDDTLSTSTSDDEEMVPSSTTTPSTTNNDNIKSTTNQKEEDEEFDFNEDDFTSIQSKLIQEQKEPSEEQSNEKQEETQQEPVRLFGLVKQEHYYYEMGFVAFILASGIIYVIGRSAGEKVFMEWAEKNLVNKIMNKHFTKVNFMRDSANQYIVYATGNEAIKHMTLKVTTPNKQDLLMGLLLKPIMGLLNGTSMLSQPEISLEMTLPRRFIVLFGMCEPKNYKNFLKQHEPLQLYTKHAQCDVNGKQFAVFTDTPTLITKLMSQSFVSYIESDLLVSDMLKPRIAGTNLVNCITLRTKIQFNKTLSEGDKHNSKNKAKHENWLDELINFISFDFNLTQQENDRNIKNRMEVKENIEKEEKKQKLKEESKENRLKKLKGGNKKTK